MHLFVLIHGLAGFNQDMEYIQKLLPGTLVFSPECNHNRTTDGIDAGAKRILFEIELLIENNPLLSQVSIIGHSLGGLYARRLVYLSDSRNSKLSSLKPRYFITLATPHVGSLQHSKIYTDFLVKSILPLVSQQTGKELLLLDNQKLLLEMVNKQHLDALRRFESLILYSNISNDAAVHFCTAAILPVNVYKEKALPLGSVIPLDEPVVDYNLPEPMATILRELNSLNWKKFGCNLPRPAHLYIINKTLWKTAAEPLEKHCVLQHLIKQLDGKDVVAVG